MIQFGRLSDLLENATDLEMPESVAFAMSKEFNQFYVLELNRRRQLFFQGINAEGKLLSSIGGEYKPFTLLKKAGTRPVNSARLINLFDTGDFYNTFNIKLEQDGFLIIADTMKEGQDLQDRWGNELLGLTDESKGLAAEQIAPDVIEYVADKLLK